MSQDTGAPKSLPAVFVVRSLFILGIVLAAAVAIKLASLLMLIFGAVIVAVILRSIADPLVKHTPLNDGFATLVSALVFVGLFAAAAFLFGRQISGQVAQLSDTLPQAWSTLQQRLAENPVGARLLTELHNLGSEVNRVFALAPKFALGFASSITTLTLVIVAGIFLASSPTGSREGVLSMFPLNARRRLREVLNACGRALKQWLLAQLFSMVLVGSLVGLGLWLIGVPSPLALALFAGLAQFIPILGPLVSAVPALLVAAIAGTQTLALTAVLFLVVSQTESNLITPLVQKNLASLPVVFGIFAVVGLGSLFGVVGALFATPFALAAYTVVTMLYRQDVLHDEVKAPGEA